MKVCIIDKKMETETFDASRWSNTNTLNSFYIWMS